MFARNSFGKYPELLKLVEDKSDEEIARLPPRRPRSGKGIQRLSNVRLNTTGQPTVILAKTVKGYGLGRSRRGQEHHSPAEEAE